MKKFHIILFLCALVLLIYTVIRITSNRSDNWNKIVPATAEKVLWIFEHGKGDSSFVQVDVPHFQINWGRALMMGLETDWLDTIPQDQPVLFTVNMWESRWFPSPGNTALEEIYSGHRDKDIIKLCKEVLSDYPNIWLRWNPEMEVPANRFPWQNAPFAYIRAFRHLDSVLSVHAPSTRLVWGPAGYPGAPEFWPGDDAAELASITLNSKSEALVSAYPSPGSAGIELKRKLHRLRFLDVPVIILARNKVSPTADDLQYIIGEREAHPEVYRIENENGNEANQSENENGNEAYQNENENGNERQSIRIGLYDPERRLISNDNVEVEHLFTDFEQVDDGRFYTSMKDAEKRNHDLIVTFEPMYPSASERDREVLNKVLAGTYDSLFSQFLTQLSEFNGQIYLRFAHEMEIPIERYPWQSQDPIKYIDAFRYFMDMARSVLPEVQRIWGPAGDRGSLEWYPGDDYVDMISVAIYGLPDKNITDPEKQESFETIYNRKYRRMSFVDKPVFITEFGVKGPDDFQRMWLQNAVSVIRKHNEIVGINYFNMIDNPDVWGEGMKAPDWSLTENTWSEFTEAVK